MTMDSRPNYNTHGVAIEDTALIQSPSLNDRTRTLLSMHRLQPLLWLAILVCILSTTIFLYDMNSKMNSIMTHVNKESPKSFSTKYQVYKIKRDAYKSNLQSLNVVDDSTANDNSVRILIVYSEGKHLNNLAKSIQSGAEQVLQHDAAIRLRCVSNVTFERDVLWADAVILGSNVINANVDAKMTEFLATWRISKRSEELTNKIGAVFVSAGGISAGEELTMVNMLHSMMIFQMIIVGGERWTSAFGASIITGEGPFAQHSLINDTSTICHSTDAETIYNLFQEKAIGLGTRVATLALAFKKSNIL